MAGEETPVEQTFTIGGADYPIPVIGTFDMDEAEILWGYLGVGLEDLVPDADGTWSDERNDEIVTLMKNPGFRKTLLHVAYRRGNPDAQAKEIQKQIGKVSNLEALAAWMAQFDALPPTPESTSKPEPQSSSEQVDSSMRSGNGSSTTSTEPDSHPEPTGVTR